MKKQYCIVIFILIIISCQNSKDYEIEKLLIEKELKTKTRIDQTILGITFKMDSIELYRHLNHLEETKTILKEGNNFYFELQDNTKSFRFKIEPEFNKNLNLLRFICYENCYKTTNDFLISKFGKPNLEFSNYFDIIDSTIIIVNGNRKISSSLFLSSEVNTTTMVFSDQKISNSLFT